MNVFSVRTLSFFLCLCLCLPGFAAFAAENTTLSFDGKIYQGTDCTLPYFYKTENSAATLTDCLSGICGELVLPQTLGGNALRAISSTAFSDSTGLISVTIPACVTEIASDAFSSLSGLKICGEAGSYAETFAAKEGLEFEIASVPGDADRSGSLSISDLTVLAKHLAGWDLSCYTKGADITQDYAVSIADLTQLAKELAGLSSPQLFLLGDETVCTELFSDDYYPQAGFGEFLEEQILSHDIENLAFSGASAKNTPVTQSYLDLFNKLDEKDAVLISFGIHDADSLFASYAPAAGDRTEAGSFSYYLYEYYLLPILSRGATPILATPIVTRAEDGATFTETCLHSDYAQAIRTLAEETCVSLVDLTEATLALYTDLGAEQNAYLNAWETRTSDSVDCERLSVFGAEQIAELVGATLSDILPKVFQTNTIPPEMPDVSSYLAIYQATATETAFVYSDGTSSTTDDTFITADSYQVPTGESLISASFAEGVRGIGDYAFFSQYDLADVSPLPQSLVSIGNGAFHSCNSLKLDLLPDTLETIGDAAFYGCESITVDTLSKSICSLGEYAFYGCDSVTALNFNAALSFVPANSFRNCQNLSEICLNEFVEVIEARAFENCYKITEITLPEDLRTLGRRALMKTSLSALSVPAALQELGEEALAGCSALFGLTYPLPAADWVAIEKGGDWYSDTLLKTVQCDDGEVTVEGVVLVDYHAYYTTFAAALSDACAGNTENADLTRHEREQAKAAILMEDEGLTLKLFENIDLYETTALTGIWTLDLQGYALLFSAADAHFELSENADITFSDSVGGGRVVKAIDSDSAQYLYNLSNAGTHLTITGGTHTLENNLNSAIAVRGMGTAGSLFSMSGGALSATAGGSGNAKAVQAPETTRISGGALAAKTLSGNSYTVSGIGSFYVSGGNLDSYTSYGNSIALFVGSGTSLSSAEISGGIFTAHASGINGKHVALNGASGSEIVIYNGTFTVDSKKTGDAGACGIATGGTSLVIHNAFAQGNSAGLQALGVNTTVYDGIFIGADHGGAYFSHNGEVGNIYVFGGTYRFVLPEWQISTSGTGSSYFTGGGKIYIDSATFEGRQVSVSNLGGDAQETTVYISNTKAPSFRIDSLHTVYFGENMENAVTSGSGTVNFTIYSATAFNQAYVDSLSS